MDHLDRHELVCMISFSAIP